MRIPAWSFPCMRRAWRFQRGQLILPVAFPLHAQGLKHRVEVLVSGIAGFPACAGLEGILYAYTAELGRLTCTRRARRDLAHAERRLNRFPLHAQGLKDAHPGG